MNPIPWLIAGCTIACACIDEPADVSTIESGLQATIPQNPLEPAKPPQGARRLTGSQLSRLNVGLFSKLTVSLPSGPAMFRTSCGGEDTGMLVVKRSTSVFDPVKDARYNDDCSGSYCTDPANSKIDFGSQGAFTYDVYTFSNSDDSFLCYVQSSTTNGLTWANLGGTNQVIGAKLVDVGAVKRADSEYFEVKTLANDSGVAGPAASDTVMMLFDVGTPSIASTGVYSSTWAPIYNDNSAPGDRDPKIGPNIASPQLVVSSCTDPCGPAPPARHFLVIGMPPASATTNVTVDLVRGPADAAGNAAGTTQALTSPRVVRDGWSCTTSTISVEPGTYQASFDAVATKLYGGGNLNDACELVDGTCGGPYYRGYGNSLAFKLKLQRYQGKLWVDVPGTQRDVPIASFGSGGLNRKLVDFEQMGSSEMPISLCFTATDSSVTIARSWSIKKNPRFSELKVATTNLLHFDSNQAEHKNIANLFLTRGRRTSVGIEHDRDQSPFQWGADIVAFQEKTEPSAYNDILVETEQQSDLDWHFNYGSSKTAPVAGYYAYSGLFTHEYLRFGTFSPIGGAECSYSAPASGVGADQYAHCYHADSEDDWPQIFSTYSVPGTTKVKRWAVDGVADQPIMVYNVQLEPWASNTDNRLRELDSLTQTITEHLTNGPWMFNNDPDPSRRTSPTDPGNRIILIGDFNLSSHDFGENRWVVEKLRQKFGYAVDVAAADQDSYARFYDMHDLHGAGIDSTTQLPASYMDDDAWVALTDPTKTWWWNTATYGTTFGADRTYPYWARTTHGQGHDYHAGGERNDAIILVGKGWEKDDPVRKYVVMNTTAQGDSPFAMKDAAGHVLAVDIWYGEDGVNGNDADVPGSTSSPTAIKHYRPNYDIDDVYDDTCTGNGCAAFRTDHIPIAARLRITQ